MAEDPRKRVPKPPADKSFDRHIQSDAARISFMREHGMLDDGPEAAYVPLRWVPANPYNPRPQQSVEMSLEDAHRAESIGATHSLYTTADGLPALPGRTMGSVVPPPLQRYKSKRRVEGSGSVMGISGPNGVGLAPRVKRVWPAPAATGGDANGVDNSVEVHRDYAPAAARRPSGRPIKSAPAPSMSILAGSGASGQEGWDAFSDAFREGPREFVDAVQGGGVWDWADPNKNGLNASIANTGAQLKDFGEKAKNEFVNPDSDLRSKIAPVLLSVAGAPEAAAALEVANQVQRSARGHGAGAEGSGMWDWADPNKNGLNASIANTGAQLKDFGEKAKNEFVNPDSDLRSKIAPALLSIVHPEAGEALAAANDMQRSMQAPQEEEEEVEGGGGAPMKKRRARAPKVPTMEERIALLQYKSAKKGVRLTRKKARDMIVSGAVF